MQLRAKNGAPVDYDMEKCGLHGCEGSSCCSRGEASDDDDSGGDEWEFRRGRNDGNSSDDDGWETVEAAGR